MPSTLRRVNWPLLLCVALATAVLWRLDGSVYLFVSTNLANTRFVPDPWTGYRLRERASSEFNNGINSEINSEGLRNPPVTAREPGELRVFFAGSSVTCAMDTPRQDNFCGQVETLLRQRLKRPVTTINGGVDGYTMLHKRLLLQALWPRYRPDIVVVTLTLDEATATYYLPPDPESEWRLRIHAFAQHSHILQYAMLSLHNAEGFGNWPPEVPVGRALPGPALDANFNSFYDFSRQNHVPVLFVVLPYGKEAGHDWEKPLRRIMRENTDGRGNPAVWVEEAPAWQALKRHGFANDDLHLRESGHTVVANLLGEELVRRDWAMPEGPPRWSPNNP